MVDDSKCVKYSQYTMNIFIVTIHFNTGRLVCLSTNCHKDMVESIALK